MWAVVCISSLMMVGCGGGEKESASVNDVTVKRLEVAVDARLNGVVTRDVQQGNQVSLVATVSEVTDRTRAGAVISSTRAVPSTPQQVRFSLPAGFAILSPASGIVLTNELGVATVNATIGAIAGAAALTASVEGATPAAISTYSLQVTAIQVPVSVLDLPAIVNAGEVITITARVNLTNSPGASAPSVKSTISNKAAKFSTDGGVFEPTSGAAITDADGVARIRFRANRAVGQFFMNFEVADLRLKVAKPYRVLVPTVTVAPLEITSPVEAGGAAEVRARIVGIATPVTVNFTSDCVRNRTATITSPVVSVAGVASAVYRPLQGCLGTDIIRASVTVEGLVFEAEAEATVQISPPRASGIEFVSVKPAAIAFLGRGSTARPDNAEFEFRVVSDRGIAVAGIPVQFSVSGLADVQLTERSAVSDQNGVVRTRVRAGRIPGVATVRASIPSGASTLSEALTVSTGSAYQSGLSISASTFTPEAFNFDGEVVTLGIRAVDRFGNPVSSRAQLVAEGGSVTPFCDLRDGACEVRWTSQNPRPTNGRVTILVRASGDEAFTDQNGNGLFDTGEPFEDLGEAFLDNNEDGIHNVGEFFNDVNNDGAYSGPNGQYDGSLCTSPPCSSFDVRRSVVLVLSTSQQRIELQPAQVVVTELSPALFEARISDLNGNLPPGGSKISISTTVGKLAGPAEFTVGTSTSPGPLVIAFQVDGDGKTATGRATVKVTTPKGVESVAGATIISRSVCDAPIAPLPAICTGGNTVGAVIVNPSTIRVLANTPADVDVVVRVVDSSPQARPFSGQAVNVQCSTGAGFQVSANPTRITTDSTGEASFRISVTSVGAVVGVPKNCVASVGTKIAIVTIGP